MACTQFASLHAIGVTGSSTWWLSIWGDRIGPTFDSILRLLGRWVTKIPIKECCRIKSQYGLHECVNNGGITDLVAFSGFSKSPDSSTF